MPFDCNVSKGHVLARHDLREDVHVDIAPGDNCRNRLFKRWQFAGLQSGDADDAGAFRDEPVDGRVHDPARTDYIARHIDAVGEAIRQGVRMEGYMVWSLLDNFEWASGYAKRFGIVHVDYATQLRTPKTSYAWYRDFLARRRLAVQAPAAARRETVEA